MFESCIEKILRGPWHFIQLRGNLLSREDIDRGDVDFLGNVKSINALIAANPSSAVGIFAPTIFVKSDEAAPDFMRAGWRSA